MCGIVGYIGDGSAKEIILSGLRRLEYRGYDSAGIALTQKGKIVIKKESGELSNLEKRVLKSDFDSNIGIGHTRWATHGRPIKENAHPHLSSDGQIAIVHNGILENYIEIKKRLIEEHGIIFKSETDSEVIAQLISIYYKGDLFEAVTTATSEMHGAYAIGVIAASEPDKVVAVRQDAPLIAGLGVGCNFLASDIPAVLEYTKDIFVIENGETVVITKDEIKIFDEDHTRVNREISKIEWDVAAAEKDGYEDFMLKEINEQPHVIRDTLTRRMTPEGEIKLEGISLTKKDIENINRIYIVACGTANHAGMQGVHLIEKFAGIPAQADLASEFRYRCPIVDEHTLCICVSQSGETTDTLEALREAKKRGARILSICNVVESSVARESDDVMYTWAGPEISVASTKAYTTQLICFYLIALYMGKTSGRIADFEYERMVGELRALPDKVSEVLSCEAQVQELAEKFAIKEQVFYIGRGQDVGTAYEASLKLKEISYINSLAIAAGELKHGTIALVRKDTLFFAIAMQDFLYEKILSNIQEIKARDAYVISVAKAGNTRIAKVSDDTIFIPTCADEMSPVLSIVPMQLFAYYVAKQLKRNIDKPRNLAKSVTVE